MKPKVFTLTKQDVFERLQELERQLTIRADDVTVQDVMDKFNWGRVKVERYLSEMVKVKELTLVTVLTQRGKKTRAWRSPE